MEGDQIMGILKPIIDYELEAELIGRGQIVNFGQVGVKVKDSSTWKK